MEPLPFGDEHRIPLAAGAEAGWRALVAGMRATGAARHAAQSASVPKRNRSQALHQ